MNRRIMLSTSALIAIQGCVSQPTSPVAPSPDDPLAKGITFVREIADALSNLMQSTDVQHLLGAKVFGEVQTVVVFIHDTSLQLSGVTSKSSAASIVAALLPEILKVLSLIGVSLPPPFDIVLPSISALLPVISSIFGLTMPAQNSRHARIAAVVHLSPETAYIALRNFNHKTYR